MNRPPFWKATHADNGPHAFQRLEWFWNRHRPPRRHETRLRSVEAHFCPEHADTCRRDDSGCFRKDAAVRWQFGVPPKGNANFA
jgi:hypothetical protein